MTRRLEALTRIGYRELLDVPGIARAHDYQRLLSYGLGGAVVLMLGVSAFQALVVTTICVAMLLMAGHRLISRRQPAPFPLAVADLIAAAVVAAVASGSSLVTLLIAAIVGFALLATFRVRILPGLAVTAIVGLGGMTLAVLSAGSSSPDRMLAAFVVVALFLVVAVLILAFFGMQSQRLRQSLSSREAELGAVLTVTPVVLASIDRGSRVSAVAGVDAEWLGRPGHVVPGPVEPLVDRARKGGRAVADLAIEGRVFNVTCLPGDRSSVLLTAYDITAREKARHRLEELLQSKDSFVAAISHELRTPLTAVLGFAEEARQVALDSDPLMPMLDVIAEQSAEMSSIIEDLLVAARADQGSLTVVTQVVDLADEVVAVVSALSSRLTTEPTLRLESATCLGDPVRIRQVIRNLVTNADRYGGGTVEIRTGAVGGSGILEVADDGSELGPDLRDRIFEPYHSSGPVRGEPAAMGLGLAVSRRLASLMDGELVYDHQQGWSVFRLTLPSAVSHSEAADSQVLSVD